MIPRDSLKEPSGDQIYHSNAGLRPERRDMESHKALPVKQNLFLHQRFSLNNALAAQNITIFAD